MIQDRTVSELFPQLYFEICLIDLGVGVEKGWGSGEVRGGPTDYWLTEAQDSFFRKILNIKTCRREVERWKK